MVNFTFLMQLVAAITSTLPRSRSNFLKASLYSNVFFTKYANWKRVIQLYVSDLEKSGIIQSTRFFAKTQNKNKN